MLEGSWKLETLNGAASDPTVPSTLSMDNGAATGMPA